VCSHGFHFNGVSCVAAPAAPAAGVGGRILLAFVLGALALTSLRLAAAVR
jgi:hypothetical protein